MDARSYPRTKLTVPVGLYREDEQRYHQRKSCNISLGGLFLAGTSCGRNGTPLQVIFKPGHPPQDEPPPFPAVIVRNTASGFALQFGHLGEREKSTLEQVIWPRWDGRNVLEGLLCVAPHETATDLASWLRLTALVGNQYRRLCGRKARTPAER